MNTIKYKEYVGSVDFDDEIDMFHGRVSNMRDVVSFYGSSVKELRAAMKVSIEEYLTFCKERSIEPAKSFSGRVNLRTDPELHRLMSQAAAEAGKSLNSWSIEQLEQAMHS